MNELLFRAKATAVFKEANRQTGARGTGLRLSELDIDVIVSEAIRIAGRRIEDCPGPIGGFYNAIEYMQDVLFDRDDGQKAEYCHVIEAMWGMPNWLCVVDNGCWDCMRDGCEVGNRDTCYLCTEDRESIRIRIDGLYAVMYKRSGVVGTSDKSIQQANFRALKAMVDRATQKSRWKNYSEVV